MQIDDRGDIVGVRKNGANFATQDFLERGDEALVGWRGHGDGRGILERIQHDRVTDGGYFARELVALPVGDLNLEGINEGLANTIAPKLTHPGVGQQVPLGYPLNDREVIAR